MTGKSDVVPAIVALKSIDDVQVAAWSVSTWMSPAPPGASAVYPISTSTPSTVTSKRG